MSEAIDIPLADDREEYADLLLRVREAAAARGLTFREVMVAMARRVIEVMEGGGGPDTLQERHMSLAQKKPITDADRMRAQLNGGVRTPQPPETAPFAAPAAAPSLPEGIEMGIGEPPASVAKKQLGKVNPLVAFIATLKVGGWVKFDTRKYSKMTVSWAIRTVKKNYEHMEFERRQAIDGHCIVVVRKK